MPWKYVIVFTLAVIALLAAIPEPSAAAYLEDKDARIGHSMMLVCSMFTALLGVLFGVVIPGTPPRREGTAK